MYVQRDQQGQLIGAYSNEQEYAIELVADDAPELLAFLSPPPGVPQLVTMRQARRALLDAGLLTTVDAAIAAMPGPAGEAARIDWQYATVVERGASLVQGLSATLGLTVQQLDDLFTAAAAIPD